MRSPIPYFVVLLAILHLCVMGYSLPPRQSLRSSASQYAGRHSLRVQPTAAATIVATGDSYASTPIVEMKNAPKVSIVAEGGAPVAGGSSEIMPSVFNLAKTILGAGILSLPAAAASVSDQTQSLPLACALLVIMGSISAYTFSSIGSACQQHGVSNFKEAWAASIDPKSASAMSFLITSKTLFSCLAYSIIIGDTFSKINLPFSREAIMWTLTSSVVLPLCLLKSLDALKYTSILGLLGIVYCAGFMILRYLDGSYAAGGRFFLDIAANPRPSFNVRGTVMDEKIFILLSTLATAFVAHYNAPKFWSELARPTMKRYNTVVTSAFCFSAVMYIIVMVIGFLTFGGNSAGFVLNNYSPADRLASIGRLAIGTGILFGFPLTFSALRDGLFELLRTSPENKSRYRPFVTVGLLGLITSVGVRLRNLGLVVSLSGSLIGSALIYIIPAIMNIKNIPKKYASSSSSVADGSTNTKRSLELALNYFIVAMGIAVSIVGVKTSLQGAGH